MSSETKDTDPSSDSRSLPLEFLDVTDRGYLENLEVPDHGHAHYPEQSQSQHTAVESRGLASAIRADHLPPHVEQSPFTFRCQIPISLERPESDGHRLNLGWTAESNDMAQPGPSATPCPVHAHYRLAGDRRKRQTLHRRRRTGDLSAVEPFPLLPVEIDLRRYHATVRDEQDDGEASSSSPVRPILMNSVDAKNTPSPITQGTEPVPVIVETSKPQRTSGSNFAHHQRSTLTSTRHFSHMNSITPHILKPLMFLLSGVSYVVRSRY